MGCFGGGGASAQREADHLAAIARYKAEVGTLKKDVSRLEREMVEQKAKSSNQIRELEEEVKTARRDANTLNGQLDRAADKEGEVAEHTVSLIQEISDLKSRLRAGGGRGAAADTDEVLYLKKQLEEAREEAKTYSEEIGDLARQVSELQSKQVEMASYKKEIKYLRMKLGDDAGSYSDDASDASNLFGFKGDLGTSSAGGNSSTNSSLLSSNNSSPIKSARGTFQIDAKNVIQTVSLTSGFFGSVSDGSVTLSKGEEASRSSNRSQSTSLRSGTTTPTRASVVTPTATGSKNITHIDAEVVSNAIKCVEDLIKRVNQSRSKGASLSNTTPRRAKSFEDNSGIEVFDLPASMRGTFEDDSTEVSVGTNTSGRRENDQQEATTDTSEQNSSFYSAASTNAGDGKEASSMRVTRGGKSPRAPRSPSASSADDLGSAILDTSSWRPVGTTGELLAVSDESTIGTLDGGDFLDDSSSCYSAYSAPVLTSSRKTRNESAVIIADLYRVQNLLSSVLEGRPHVKEQLQSSLMSANSFVRSSSGFSAVAR